MALRFRVCAGIALGVALGHRVAVAGEPSPQTTRGFAGVGWGFATGEGIALGAAAAPRLVHRLFLPFDGALVKRNPRWSWSAGAGALLVLDRAPVTLRASLRYRSFVRETGSTLFEDALVTFERRDAGAELGVGYVYPIGRLVFGVELAQYTPIVTFSNDQVLRSKHSGRVIHVYPGDQRDDAERRLHGYAAWVF